MRSGFLRCVAGVVGLALIGSASAERQVFVTVPDTFGNFDGFFSLNFGDGVERNANISNTFLTLAVDADAGTAAFLEYRQSVASLELPGGVSTGLIHIAIAPGSSSGTFDGAAIATTDTYAISFANDLSMFGLSSPVMLPGESDGMLQMLTEERARLQLVWDGVGQLQNPFDPENPIVFTYTCSVTKQLALAPNCPRNGCWFGDVNGDCRSDLTDLAIQLSNFGTFGSATRADGDVNADGHVDLSDLASLLTQFGNDCD